MENLPNNNIMPVPPSTPPKGDLFSMLTQTILTLLFIELLQLIIIITVAPSYSLARISIFLDDVTHFTIVISALYLVFGTIDFNSFKKTTFVGLSVCLLILILGLFLLCLNVSNISFGYLLLPVIAMVLLVLQKEKFVN